MVKKEELLKAMQQFDEQTLSIAYLYAKNFTLYGADVTEKWITATQQSANLERAYRDGYYKALKEVSERGK